MNIFYCTDLSGHSVILGEEDSKHAVKVLRLKSGDRIELVDGKGVRANGEIDDAHPKKCSVIITDRKKESSGRTYSLHIAIAPTKNSDRTEWFVEKAVEIGIDQITLLDCAHSERKRMNTDRLEKVAIAAMKQSEQSRLPHINAMVPVKKFLKNDLNTVGDIVIMIGPEGDFSKDEILAAMFTGFKEISFGDTRLRTETAALMAVMSVKVLS